MPSRERARRRDRAFPGREAAAVSEVMSAPAKSGAGAVRRAVERLADTTIARLIAELLNVIANDELGQQRYGKR
jgi:hypothetical protein